eukprot:CAMPEP_0205914092 /NCGR_PEP_ID=MMETSP1325-20131115/6999_1 /ASSEMBLY_ACC=CAM_ASM_000708 /TAXON_ID=236786 /ORGANISM="Florenciella sp., Strain RCC1007" /LENGTH=107 /DNA_ID=CAMNT_0053281097 /DNA_START=64 /DNA_END=388 /DNA_ORIENTATION=+
MQLSVELWSQLVHDTSCLVHQLRPILLRALMRHDGQDVDQVFGDGFRTRVTEDVALQRHELKHHVLEEEGLRAESHPMWCKRTCDSNTMQQSERASAMSLVRRSRAM